MFYKCASNVQWKSTQFLSGFHFVGLERKNSLQRVAGNKGMTQGPQRCPGYWHWGLGTSEMPWGWPSLPNLGRARKRKGPLGRRGGWMAEGPGGPVGGGWGALWWAAGTPGDQSTTWQLLGPAELSVNQLPSQYFLISTSILLPTNHILLSWQNQVRCSIEYFLSKPDFCMFMKRWSRRLDNF